MRSVLLEVMPWNSPSNRVALGVKVRERVSLFVVWDVMPFSKGSVLNLKLLVDGEGVFVYLITWGRACLEVRIKGPNLFEPDVE